MFPLYAYISPPGLLSSCDTLSQCLSPRLDRDHDISICIPSVWLTPVGQEIPHKVLWRQEKLLCSESPEPTLG